MSASLSPMQVAQYQRDGYLYPVDCLTPEEVRYFRGRLEDFERGQGDAMHMLWTSYRRTRFSIVLQIESTNARASSVPSVLSTSASNKFLPDLQ